MHCALSTLITTHLVLEYNAIYFMARGLKLPGNCIILAVVIFPKTSPADRSSEIRDVDFSSFSFINLDMSVTTSISVFGYLSAKKVSFFLVWHGLQLQFMKIDLFIVHIIENSPSLS